MCSHHGSDLWWLSWAWLRHGAVIMMWMRGGLIVCIVWEFKVERTGTVFIVSFLMYVDTPDMISDGLNRRGGSLV